MKIAKIILLTGLLTLGLFLAFNRDIFEANLDALWLNPGPVMTTRIENFTETMSEEDVRRRVPEAHLSCVSDTSAPGLGDRVCYGNISSYAGIRALRIAFFWRKGRLSNIKVDLPWWQHPAMKRQLFQDFGDPTGSQLLPVQGVRLLGWRLPNGNLLYNRDPDFNPLWWNTIQWVGPGEAAEKGGIFVPKKPPCKKPDPNPPRGLGGAKESTATEAAPAGR